jgi:hypothetical protein
VRVQGQTAFEFALLHAKLWTIVQGRQYDVCVFSTANIVIIIVIIIIVIIIANLQLLPCGNEIYSMDEAHQRC